VSGLSSGAFFAHQFHIAFSKLVSGAGIVAGGPYGCVENIPNPFSWFATVPLDRMSAALVACTQYFGDRYFSLHPSEPIREVWTPDQRLAARRLSKRRIMARRTKAAALQA
jgi:hypothetical protein